MPIVLPNPQTVALVALFAVVYLVVLFAKTVRGKIDLYDLIMLSMVAILPLIFVLFPALAAHMAELTGVGFPFIIMFGGLLFVVFVFMHRMTTRLHKLERNSRTLVQELSLLALDSQRAPPEDGRGA